MRFRPPALVGALSLVAALGCNGKKGADLTPAPDAATTASTTLDAGAAPASSGSADCASGPNVDFHGNAAIEAELREELGVREGPVPLRDLAKIANVNFIQATVDDLDPCLFPLFTGARNLFLGRGNLENLAPLASLTQLNALQIAYDKVSDIHVLGKMTQLDRLDLEHTQVQDIGPLANLTALTLLQLDSTPVSDLSPLASCKSLEKLSIRDTKVTDVSPLKDLKKLRFLYIEGSPIKDTSSLAPLQKAGLKIVRKGRP